jgi:hypothetical protein
MDREEGVFGVDLAAKVGLRVWGPNPPLPIGERAREKGASRQLT